MSDNFTSPLSGLWPNNYTPTSAADINLYTYTHNVVVACYFSHCYRQCTHLSARYKLSFRRRLLATGWDKGRVRVTATPENWDIFSLPPIIITTLWPFVVRVARYLDLIDEHLLQCERSAEREWVPCRFTPDQLAGYSLAAVVRIVISIIPCLLCNFRWSTGNDDDSIAPMQREFFLLVIVGGEKKELERVKSNGALAEILSSPCPACSAVVVKWLIKNQHRPASWVRI